VFGILTFKFIGQDGNPFVAGEFARTGFDQLDERG